MIGLLTLLTLSFRNKPKLAHSGDPNRDNATVGTFVNALAENVQAITVAHADPLDPVNPGTDNLSKVFYRDGLTSS
jgi:hypothetical protein